MFKKPARMAGMKIYSHIIPESGQISQKKSLSESKSSFEHIFQRVLAQKVTETREESPSSTVSGAELFEKAEKILETLENLSLGKEFNPEMSRLKDLLRDVSSRLVEVPPGPSRKLLEEVVLLGVVEAEKHML
jgi:hypothetical protein